MRENDFEWVDEVTDLPFEISSTPTNKPKLSNRFRVKSTWYYGDLYIRESFDFNADKPNHFEQFVNLIKFYKELLSERPERWRDVSAVAKKIGLALGSYDDEEAYGTPKDMSDFVIGTDYPAWLEEFDVYYYDKGGVEYPVNIK